MHNLHKRREMQVFTPVTGINLISLMQHVLPVRGGTKDSYERIPPGKVIVTLPYLVLWF